MSKSQEPANGGGGEPKVEVTKGDEEDEEDDDEADVEEYEVDQVLDHRRGNMVRYLL